MPWNVGRYKTTQDVISRADGLWTDDLHGAINNGKEYLICVFPGFSWHNWNGGSFDAIPRRDGDFLWEQFYNAKRIGATMIYQAMFDEVDESSAIFKVTNDPPPPSGNIEFLTLQGLASDEYLWLVGEGTKMLRGQIPMDPTRPVTALKRMIINDNQKFSEAFMKRRALNFIVVCLAMLSMTAMSHAVTYVVWDGRPAIAAGSPAKLEYRRYSA